MSKNYFIQNKIKKSFLLFCLYVQINCHDLAKNNTHNETFSKYNTTFNNEIKQKFSIITFKINTIKYNVILKMKYYDIKIIYESISKTISLLETLMIENNWNEENENKFNNEIKNFETYSIKFNSFYNDFNNRAADYKILYQELIKFIKIFFTVLFIISLIILVSSIVISFFVIRRQRRYYRLNEEVSLRIEQGKSSETSRSRQKVNEKKEENIQIREPKKYNVPSSRNEIIELTSKKQNTFQSLKSEYKEKI